MKKSVFLTCARKKLSELSRQISFHSKLKSYQHRHNVDSDHFDRPDVIDKGIYILQTIEIKKENFDIFFDSGCGDLCVKKSAIDRLEKLGRAKQVRKGPIKLFEVGYQSSVSDFGIYQISLPLFKGENAIMSGICIEQVTNEFPMYPLQGKVQSDIQKE